MTILPEIARGSGEWPMQTATVELDQELMLRMKAGEAECFEILLNRHRRSIVHYLNRMVQNSAVAEELAQDVFLRVYNSRERYQPAAKFTSWLYRIATHLALNCLRDRRHEQFHESLDERPAGTRHRDVVDPLPTADQAILRRLAMDQIRRAVNELPDRQRAAVLMHKYEGMDYAEIAAALNCTVPGVKSVMWRAYSTLRLRLAHLVPDPGADGPPERRVA